MIRRNLYYFTPVLFFFLMLIDAHLTQVFIATSQNHYIWRAHLVLIAMLIAVKQLPKHYMITVALIIGSLFDLYYLGILGIYAVVFPVTIWLMYLIYGILFENDFNLFFGMIIFVTFFELFIVGLQLISINQGLRSSPIIKSAPYNSNVFFLASIMSCVLNMDDTIAFFIPG